jgi:alanine racemase
VTQLEIHSTALAHNVRTLKAQLTPQVRFIAVVKANAYGHGAVQCAKQLEALAVDYLAVAYADEGAALRAAGIQLPILVFYPEADRFSTIVAQRLTPAIYSTTTWEALLKALSTEGKPYPIHLKFNTGLNRIGFSLEEMEWIFAASQHPKVQVEGVYSHLCATEEARPHAQVNQQIEFFEQIRNRFITHPHQPWFHLLNTSGVFNYPEYHLDAVRCGIGLYGYANSERWDRTLQPIAQLKTRITQMHTLKAGEYVGYNQGWQAQQDCTIATLPIGHADGIQRGFARGTISVKIKGQQASVVGKVCMDMLMVDVSGLQCQEGDEVLVFGPEQPLSVWAKKAGTISYEVLTGLGSRIKRVWV